MVLDTGANPGSAREAWSRPTVRVDWLQGSMKGHDAATEARADESWLLTEPQRCGTPHGMRGLYGTWWKDVHGTTVGLRMLPSDDAPPVAAKSFLILKGSGLVQLRADGVSDRAALERFAAWKGSCTRLDLAIDVRHPAVTPRAFRDKHEGREILTRLEKPGWWGDEEHGTTWYLGAGDCLLRVYDKTAERAKRGAPMIDGVTRIELELRRKSARTALRKLLALSPDEWAEGFPKLAIGWLLNKARPLDGRVPERNPQRAKTWSSLLEALEGIGPVALGRDDADRSAEARVAAKLRHLKNNLGFLREIEGLVGRATLLQMLDSGVIDEAAAFTMSWADTNPERVQEMLKSMNLATPQRAETGELWPDVTTPAVPLIDCAANHVGHPGLVRCGLGCSYVEPEASR